MGVVPLVAHYGRVRWIPRHLRRRLRDLNRGIEQRQVRAEHECAQSNAATAAGGAAHRRRHSRPRRRRRYRAEAAAGTALPPAPPPSPPSPSPEPAPPPPGWGCAATRAQLAPRKACGSLSERAACEKAFHVQNGLPQLCGWLVARTSAPAACVVVRNSCGGGGSAGDEGTTTSKEGGKAHYGGGAKGGSLEVAAASSSSAPSSNQLAMLGAMAEAMAKMSAQQPQPQPAAAMEEAEEGEAHHAKEDLGNDEDDVVMIRRLRRTRRARRRWSLRTWIARHRRWPKRRRYELETGPRRDGRRLEVEMGMQQLRRRRRRGCSTPCST